MVASSRQQPPSTLSPPTTPVPSLHAKKTTTTHAQGALLCLAAATVGLGDPSEAYLRQIVPPVLASFTDQDSRVRYYACEALYNIAKVGRPWWLQQDSVA